MTPYQKAGFNELSLFRVVKDPAGDLGEGGICWLDADDGSNIPHFATSTVPSGRWMRLEDQLQELLKDKDGFYLWKGGECPVPGDWGLHIKTVADPDGVSDISGDLIQPAKDWDWQTSSNPITAFKPISRPEMPSVAECATEEAGSAMEVQEGGDHYKKLKIQPMEYSMANKLDACQHTIIKYVTRFRDKGGIEDLRKAKHCIDMLIEFESEALEGGE